MLFTMSKRDQESLVKYLNKNDISSFISLLEKRDAEGKPLVDPNHEYGDPYYNTCLIEASKRGLPLFIEALVKYGADPNKISKSRDCNAPLHFAAKKGNLDALGSLLKSTKINVNTVNKFNETALHLAAENIQVDEKCFLFLITQTAININIISDRTKQTAIQQALSKGCSKETLREVLQHCNLSSVDRKLISDRYPELIGEEILQEINYIGSQELFRYLEQKEFEKFKMNLKEKYVNETCTIRMTFLQLACLKGWLDICEFLIQNKADVNLATPQEKRPPIYLSCLHGNYDILKLLVTNNADVVTIEGKTILHAVLEGLQAKTVHATQYRDCFDYLLEQREALNIPINSGDAYGHTALHYAILEEDDYYTKKLLSRGAYIGSLNKFDISPLNDIDPNTLETVLSNCIQRKEKRDNEYIMEFRFDFLKPHSLDMQMANCKGNVHLHIDEETLPEMYPLYYISQSSKLGHLLKHPTLLIFLLLKWNRIRMMFYLNIAFYTIFVSFLTADILCDSNICGENKDGIKIHSECSSTGRLFVRYVLYILFIIFFFRETVQFFISPKRLSYFGNLENWLEFGIIITTILILTGYCSKFLAAITLLFAWTEVILQFGCIYTLAIYNEMMKRVTLNYMKFLIWYSPLIIAFTFSFYKLYHIESPENKLDTFPVQNLNGNFSTEEGDTDFYRDISMSLLKTVIMMIGEFDASSMSFSHGGYFVFLFFVFMITIVLINLLNGLAVSDTQAIKNDAELVSYRSKVKLVYHFECVLFGGPLSKLQRCFPWKCFSYRNIFLKTVNLFPEILNEHNKYCLTINLTQGPRYIDHRTDDIEFRPDTCCSIGKFRLGFDLVRGVLEEAKDIVDARSDALNSEIETCIDQMKDDMNQIKRQISGMEELLKEFMNNNKISVSDI